MYFIEPQSHSNLNLIVLYQEVQLTNFKNYQKLSVLMHPRFNLLTGYNGMGKTNLLDALYYCSLTRSYFTRKDSLCHMHGSSFFRIEASLQAESGESAKLVIKSQSAKSKVVEWKGSKYDRLSDHIGRIPCIMITPRDIQLILEGSESRRALLDSCICQVDRDYLQSLQKYNHALKQRNGYLKMLNGRSADVGLIDSYNQILSVEGQKVSKRREEFMQGFEEYFKKAADDLNLSSEVMVCRYKSKLLDHDLIDLLAESWSKDLILQRTTCGIHKDDLELVMNDRPLKDYASQGQLKSFVLALKLAQYEYLKTTSQSKAILLLDDIFDRLDRNRVRALLEHIVAEDYGQVFITDTHPTRVADILTNQQIGYMHYQVSDAMLELI